MITLVIFSYQLLKGMQCRAVARFFVTGGGGGRRGHYRECQRQEPCRRSKGILPKKIVQFGGYETPFSALFMGYVSKKSTSNMKMANNCKSSQVTIIKITKSTENDSIDRLLMCPAQQV